MEWLDRVNGALDYIEMNLTDHIDYGKAAQIACCSTYQFQRMFSFITDVPLSEYIRRRRLTLAAFELQSSPIKVIDVAMKYGYDSPEAFARAFQNMHGVTPTAARDVGVKLKAYPRISFLISIKGDVEMNYRVEEKQGFSIFGVERMIKTENEENYRTIPEFWLEAMEDGTVERIGRASGKEWCPSTRGIKPVNAAMCYRDMGEEQFPYMLFAFTPEGGVKGDFTKVDIPAMTWAIFTTEEHTDDKTTEVIQALWKRIYSEWFPTSNYEALPGPELEMYGTAESGLEYCEVWIPVKKK